MATVILLEIRAFSVVEIDPSDSASKKARLWYQGGGFDVCVSGTLTNSYVTRDSVRHAALVAVQAHGGKVSQLRDINAGKRRTGRPDEQLEKAKSMTRRLI